MSLEPGASVIIGDREDPHVSAVLQSLASKGRSAIILDLELVEQRGIEIEGSDCRVKLESGWLDLTVEREAWLRRFHRADWGLGIQAGSRQALEYGSWHSAFTWALKNANLSWLTEPNAMTAAESKLLQSQVAADLGITYPRTIVTSDSEGVQSTFSGEIVVKPLGTGQFLSEGVINTVFAEAMMPDDIRLGALEAAPFIVQERVRAVRHLRVVTVRDRLWAASLEARPNMAIDWRREAVNHKSFRSVHGLPDAVLHGALSMAKELSLGYSSQDWIEGEDGELYLIDVNPAGQWLFLPSEIGDAVASAIGDALAIGDASERT